MRGLGGGSAAPQDPLGAGIPLWVWGRDGDGIPRSPCRASSAVTGTRPAHKAELLAVFIVFPSDSYPSNFGHVFDSFYLLSHHSTPCTGAAPDIPVPRAGLGNWHLKINPAREMFFLFFFFPFFKIFNCFSCCVLASLSKMAIS